MSTTQNNPARKMANFKRLNHNSSVMNLSLISGAKLNEKTALL